MVSGPIHLFIYITAKKLKFPEMRQPRKCSGNLHAMFPVKFGDISVIRKCGMSVRFPHITRKFHMCCSYTDY